MSASVQQWRAGKRQRARGEQHPPRPPRPPTTPPPSRFPHLATCKAEGLFLFFYFCDAPSKGSRSLNKHGRAIVAAAGDSLKLSAPTLQEIKFMKSVLKGARRSPKAKVELDKRGIVLMCVQGEGEKRLKTEEEQLERCTNGGKLLKA